ncbi:Phosphotransferase enzyme family protein [Georgenia satyanarayanai]|uniref:Phosphotransferase enzyme family protein n=1 Tax=Georgenia satyanarayanai TaxID=860221 RepID=A0A2Y9C6K6_9MICO|nr:phosphotransferase [Georgenia satyanarayanai]PYF99371.1 phosphotransferase family enzyme [Georgenia satyanarayanai]SSA43183.1 Phosphotransferase enzyme family protein [Georgenia satyanarayanai]
MWRKTTGRWRRALGALAVVERRSPVLPAAVRWRRLEASGPVAHGVPPHPALPGGVVPTDPGAPSVPVTAPVAADAVLIGKFDRGRQVRMRSFYAEEGLCARIQAGSRHPEREHGVSRSVRAAQLVAAHRPGLAPAMRDHGTLFSGRTAYLVEEVVEGRTPRTPTEIAAAMEVVAEELSVLQRAVGVTSKPLSAVVNPAFPERWRGVVTDGHVPPKLAARLDRLIARDELLEVSFTHGDLVSSNVLRVGDRVVLIDWEYAGTRPVAFDLAKMHVNAGPAGQALDRLDGALGGLVGHTSGHYSLAEQLALAHVVVLSRLEARMQRAREADRLEPLRRQTHKRVKAVRELLALEG